MRTAASWVQLRNKDVAALAQDVGRGDAVVIVPQTLKRKRTDI
jgi:hypothetical protein